MITKTIEALWAQYLAEANTTEENLQPVQRDEMKRSFYAGCFMTVRATAKYQNQDVSTEELFKWFKGVGDEAHHFFEGEFNKMKELVTFLVVLSQTQHPDRLELIVNRPDVCELLEEMGLAGRKEITNQIYVTDNGLALISRYEKYEA